MTENELSLSTRESFDAVMRKYADMVYRLACSRTGSVNDADDILQEVFLRYIKADKTFNDEEHRKAWLIRITINCSRSFMSSSWNRHRGAAERDENAAVTADGIEELETRSAVYGEVLKLPQKYRTVIHLHYYEELSVAEISKALGISGSAVKSRLLRAREMLRGALGEEI